MIVVVLFAVILLLFAGMFALSWTAIELTKEMRAGNGGIMTTPSGDMVSVATAEEDVSLLDFPQLSMDDLKQAKDIVFVHGSEVHYYVVASIVQKIPTSSATGMDVHIESTSGHQIVISADRTLALDGQLVSSESSRRLKSSQNCPADRRLQGQRTLRELSSCGGGATLNLRKSKPSSTSFEDVTEDSFYFDKDASPTPSPTPTPTPSSLLLFPTPTPSPSPTPTPTPSSLLMFPTPTPSPTPTPTFFGDDMIMDP